MFHAPRALTRAGSAGLVVLVASLLGGCGQWSFAPKDKPLPDAGLVTLQAPGVQEVARPQTSPTSCWAACAEAVFRYNNRPEQTQSVIAQRLDKVKTTDDAGNPLPPDEVSRRIQAAGELEVMLALHPDFGVSPDEFASSVLAWVQSGDAMMQRGKWETVLAGSTWLSRKYLVAQTMATELAPPAGRPQPILVGLNTGAMGHVVLVDRFEVVPGSKTWAGRQLEDTAINDAIPTIDQGTIYRVSYIDPQGARRVTLPAHEFAEKVDFYITRTMAIERLEGLKRTVVVTGAR